MIIYRANGTTLLNVEIDDSSYLYSELMNRDDITLEFSLPTYTEIPTGSYIVFEGKTYWLFKPAAVTVVNRRNFGYVATFETDIGKLALWRVKNTDDGHVKFSLTARPSQHLQLLVSNLNDHEGNNLWAVSYGSFDDKEITLSYNRTTVRDALSQLADSCDTEWEIYRANNKAYISFGKVEHNANAPLSLSYGKDNGFESGVKRTNGGGGLPIEVLYVQGGDRNIDPSTYFEKSSTLLLPRSYAFNFDGEHFNGESGYVSSKGVAMITDAHGYSVRLQSAARGAAEDTLDLSDIYPKREGTVTSLEIVESGGDYPFYNILDSSLGTGTGKLALDYNDYMIAGEQFTIIFQSGMLAGREIGVHKFELKEEYGVFELAQESIDGFIMPGEAAFIPATNDKYAVFGCSLPAEYIADATTHGGAEFEMLRKAARYVYENSRAKQSFKGTLSKVYARRNWSTIGPKIVLGGYVSFTDEDVQAAPVTMRIMSVKRYINNPYKPEIELSDEATKGTVGGSIQSLSNNFARVDRDFYNERGYTNRRFRDALESQSLLEAAMLANFGSGISPVTIRTMSALVGSNDLQYEFTDSTYTTVVDNTPYFNGDGNLVCSAGYVKHFTLGFSEDDFVKANRPATEFNRWEVSESVFAFTDKLPRYVYIGVTKNADRSVPGTGAYVLSATPIPFEPTTATEDDTYDTSHYYLLLGTVSSEIEGSRSIATYNGFTEVTPGMLRAMKFISNDGNQYVDFLNKRLRVGDANNYIGYNLPSEQYPNGDGILRLKGTIVQSPGGAEFPTPCYRGEYDPLNVDYYYYGDEVSYQGQSWLHTGTSATASSVAPGSDSAVWTLYAAKGANGAPGNSVIAQYSEDGSTNWHTPFSSRDLYMRTSEDGGEHWGAAIRIVGEDGQDGQDGQNGRDGVDGQNGAPGPYTDYSFAYSSFLSTANTTTPPADVSSWEDAPPATAVSGKYLWMKVVDYTLSGDTLVPGTAHYTRIGGEKGADGTSYRLDLTNELASINTDKNGNILPGAVRPTCTAVLYFGTSIVQNAVYSISSVNDNTAAGYTIDQSTGVLTFNDGTAAMPFAFSVDTLEITVTASLSGAAVTSKVMNIAKVKPGNDGQDGADGSDGNDAVSYWLVLDTDKVSVNPNNTPQVASPTGVTPTAMMQVGENAPTPAASVCTITYAYDNETEASISSGTEHTILLKNATTQAVHKTLHFYLYKGGVLVDQESVPILYDGVNGEGAYFADLDNEMDAIGVGSDGVLDLGNPSSSLTLTTTYSIWLGSEKKTLASLTAVGPTLPNGVTVTPTLATGVVTVTIPHGTELEGRYPITITGTYGTFSQALEYTIIAVKDGADGARFVLVPSVSSVKKDKTGAYSTAYVTCSATDSFGEPLAAGSYSIYYNIDGGASFTAYPNPSYPNGIPTTAFMTKLTFLLFVETPNQAYSNYVDIETIPLIIDGADGQATDGKNGKSMRGASEWSESGFAGTGSYQGENDTDPSHTFIDIVRLADDGLYYWCTNGHTASQATKPGGSNNPYWAMMNNFDLIATRALFAESAAIENLAVDSLNTGLKTGATARVNVSGGDVNIFNSSGVAVVRLTNESAVASGSGSGSGSFSFTGAAHDEDGSPNVRTLALTAMSGINITSSNNTAALTTSTVAYFYFHKNGNPIEINREVSIIAYFKDATTQKKISLGASFSGYASDNAKLNIPAQSIALPEGTWSLIFEFTTPTIDTGAYIAASVTASALSGNYVTNNSKNIIAADGFLSTWSGSGGSQGFKATASGAKVIQGGTEYDMLGGANGIKRIQIVTGNYPSTAVDGVLYIKVS